MPHDAHDHAAAGHHDHAAPPSNALDLPRYRRVLWVALVVNAAMFLVEVVAGFRAESASLLADAIDFAGDAANYGLGLLALGMAPIWRSRTALLKGASMLVFGAFVLGKALWLALFATVPDASTMGAIGVLALVANLSVAWMLHAFRHGDANMQSVWLCTRNDAFGNIAVLIAAGLVAVVHHGWPDLVVAFVMAALALHSGWIVVRMARQEIAQAKRDET
jgi:Co/Zn/Cd efflux system component